MPLYLHPGLPPKAIREACYAGFEPMTNLMLATGGWGWHAEAGLAALRLILAGTFDRHPDLQLILGHWGEMLVPFADRADALTKTTHLERPVGDYITGNVYVTAGGVFSHRMLRQNLDVLGPDRIMIGVDDPFSSTLGQKGKKQVRSQRKAALFAPSLRPPRSMTRRSQSLLTGMPSGCFFATTLQQTQDECRPFRGFIAFSRCWLQRCRMIRSNVIVIGSFYGIGECAILRCDAHHDCCSGSDS